MIEQRHFFVFDLETSGLSPTHGAEIVQIAAKSLNYQDLSDHDNGTFSIILKPQNPEKASKEAIKVIGTELWEKAKSEGIHPKVGLQKFVDYINNLNWKGEYWTAPTPVGFNSCRFDEPILIFWLQKYNIIKRDNQGCLKLPWGYYSKDVLLQLTDLFAKDNLPNRKLDTFIKMFGMSRTKETHSALEDVELTADLFVRYMNMMQKVRKKIIIEPQEELMKI